MLDDEKVDDKTEGSEGQEPPEDKPEGEEERQTGTGEEAPHVDPLAALLTPEGQRMLGQATEQIISAREAERQAQADESALLEKPDEELGRQYKESIARQQQARDLMPDVQKGFYQGVVADLIKTVPELTQLTPEEKQAVLSPNLRSDAEVLQALMNVVGEKRAASLTEAAVTKALADRDQAKTQGDIAEKDKQTVPGLGSGSPVGPTGDKTHHDDLLSEYFRENPIE